MTGFDIEKNGAITVCGKGTLENCKGVNIVHLRGSYEDMGRQHGMLSSQVCGDLVLAYFGGLLESLIGHSVKPLSVPLSNLLKWIFLKLNKKRLGQNMLDHATGLANALGVPPKDIFGVALVPDILHFLVGKVFGPFAMPPACSGFFAKDSATADGKLIIGRNFDFFGQGVWNTNNALIFMEPNDGLKSCWIGSMGVPGSGQGMNEKGIIVSLHTKFTKDVRLSGAPLFTTVSNILSSAENIDDAMKMLLAAPRMCGLSLFIVDTKARDAAIVGFSANKAEVVRPENDILVRANHYVTPQMKKLEIAPFPWVMHSEARFNRLHQILEEKRGSLKPSDVPAILSDHYDVWEERKRTVGNIVGATNNANAVVFSPDDDLMWLGTGGYPVCASDSYAGFRISALFNGDSANYAIDDLAGAKLLDEKEAKARDLYQEAWESFSENFRTDLAVFQLRKAGELLPEEPVFPRMAGILLLKLGKFKQAVPFLERNAAWDYKSKLSKAEALVWLGRGLDLDDRHSEAVNYYKQAAELNVEPVSSGARKAINAPYKKGKLFDVTPEFITGSAVSKY